jgi:hypothetical protein
MNNDFFALPLEVQDAAIEENNIRCHYFKLLKAKHADNAVIRDIHESRLDAAHLAKTASVTLLSPPTNRSPN